jgi:DNA-binding transcriptional ArsR family regulator
MVPKMSQPATQIEPLVPRDTYPVMRVAAEYFLRAVDILPEVHNDMVSSVVFVTLWHGQVQGRGRPPVGIRELSRRMGLPYETVRRHARALVRGGQFIEEKGGLAIPPAMMRSRQTAAMLRRSYVNAVRMLRHLTRIEVARFDVGPDRRLRSGRLTREQTAIGMAGIGLLLTGLRTLQELLGDLVKGLVYTAIWTANVKHVTNTPGAGDRGILKDSQRQPVSVLAISNALRLPYETVRRHANALQKEGYCARVGRKGLIAPALHHHQSRNVQTMVDGYHIVMAFLAELRRAGIKA